MTMLGRTWQDWRGRADDRVLSNRLLGLRCPGGLRMAMTRVDRPNPTLQQWVVDAMLDGRIERTAQSELVSEGRSLVAVADITGLTVKRVVFHLTRVPEPEDNM